MIDLWIVAFCMAVGLTGWSSIKAFRKRRISADPALNIEELKKSARQRAAKVDIESRLVCNECDEPVDPSAGVFEADEWWHEVCYRKMLKSN